MNGRPCTEEFLAFAFLGAVCQLLNGATTHDFDDRPPAALFSLSQAGRGGSCDGHVKMVTLDEEFVVVSLNAPTGYSAFTPALRRALGADEEDRSVVEMYTLEPMGYRIMRSHFTKFITHAE